jgi:hypothetical protein
MRTMLVAVGAIAFAIAISGCAEQRTGVQAAADAMGATTLNSIQYSGNGSAYAFGQAFAPGERWPRFDAKTYVVAVDYQTPSMRVEIVRAQGEHPPRGGGGQPFATEQRTIQAVSGKYAWSEGGAQPVANPDAVSDRVRQVWLTPHGVIKAALASGAAATGNSIALNIEGRDVKVTLNDQNLVDRVEYLTTNSVVGDVPVEITYSDYADYGGVKFPKRIVEKQDGFETLDVTIGDVKTNPTVGLDVPQAVAQATAPPAVPKVDAEKVANGVWSLNAAGTRSLAVEFKDHIVMLEGPTSEARSLAVNDVVGTTVPGKPIRYVVNTHPHYDHAGGLRTYVAQGVTVVTYETNKPFFEQVWSRPRTIEPDLLAKSPRPATFETASDKKVMTDGSRTLELYRLQDSGHNAATLIAYLPAERILMYGDGYNPPPGDDPRDPTRTLEFGMDLYKNVQRLNLNVARIAPVHGRVVPFDNFKKAMGLPSLTN